MSNVYEEIPQLFFIVMRYVEQIIDSTTGVKWDIKKKSLWETHFLSCPKRIIVNLEVAHGVAR